MLLVNDSGLTAEYITSICEGAFPESSTLDFKQILPEKDDEAKGEFLKDIASFANFDGGDIIYGIAETKGIAAKVLPITQDLPDPTRRRLSQIIDAGIEPRISGIRIIDVQVDGGYVLVIRIPASFEGPHAVRATPTTRRFVMRNGTTTSDMSYEQLRSAFDKTASLAYQAKKFIQERQQLLINLESPLPMASGAFGAMHLVPLSGFANRNHLNLHQIYQDDFPTYATGWGSIGRDFNLEGLLVYEASGLDHYYGYVQLFRNSQIEAMGHVGDIREMQGENKFIIWSVTMSQFFVKNTENLIRRLLDSGCTGPALLSFSLLHIQDAALAVDNMMFLRRTKNADRPNFIIPELYIDDLQTVNPLVAAKHLLDVLWQGFGYQFCLDFNQTTGDYAPRR